MENYDKFNEKIKDKSLLNQSLSSNLQILKNDSAIIDEKIQKIKENLQYNITQTEKINKELISKENLRRNLHNQYQDLKGNIRVFCRIRPSINTNEKLLSMEFPDEFDENKEILIKEPITMEKLNQFGTNPINTTNYNNRGNNYNSVIHSFEFDRIFGMDTNNAEIFDEISQLVKTSLYGFNVCIFAYGQTGSGKTYTMSNLKDGMIPKAVNQIFDTINDSTIKLKGWNYKIYGQFLEIYNETIHDLLNNNNNKDDKKKKLKYEIRHDPLNEKTIITNLSEIELLDVDMVNEILIKANNNRSVASTKSNERSSRSHSIFRIKIVGENPMTRENTEGILNLIDLAGSERLSQSQVTGERLKETQAINKSLSCLGDVIYALGNNNTPNGHNSISNSNHIPFRNSKLTYLLQYSLSGKSKTLMFVTIPPFEKNFNETLNSLRFAKKVNNTKICNANGSRKKRNE
ncbi:Kar3p [Ascoidea rubescens DSM 1968]|uniref:Kinesin-domain-containing protein n=1 Tax=Ascoidea rubescens DSM 1968 TaxID=1344418 RepID=A0A1D2VMI7_9ASCO|nr:kinesin-domain-containing protein [Ascoidea rubescens DSM 1968]ODV62777.1 kinesin-domain-containing protein [Ascoidea rubescens DSM 1968]